jgi:serine/threonine protein kinase/tetratricopeptide (TPR) repeat protein
MRRIEPDRWQVVSPHLDAALDIPDERGRAAWLAALRDRDPALAADVDALLREHRALQRDRFLESPLPPPPSATKVGERVGPYTLLSTIGCGGMGTVWLAERSDGRFERRVAIKFVNRALIGGDERFRREGRILARLAHRHIAQLLDAGVSAAGEPYLVLEHVDGEPIDRYCDRHALDIHARLRLFLGVLDAVAQAHASLIVHRDIKPSNVLVTADGGVKLLDFGIATLLEGEHDSTAVALTGDGNTAMTPAYAAPEQVLGQPVSTATDVYALGVLLYVLLTGRHPADDSLHSHAELIKAIADAETPRPSSRAPDKLRRVLRGDLDTIVTTAMKKDPAARFASVTAFADDVRRHLRHEPIAARPDSIAYRSIKFVRRNRLGVAALLLIVASLSAGLYAANRERATAERRFTQVRQLANKVIALDGHIRAVPGSTKARYEIVAMAKEYLEALRPDAASDPDLALEIGDAYFFLATAQGLPTTQNLGQYAEAEESLRTADALLQSVLVRTPRNRAALLRSAQIAEGRMMLTDSPPRRDESLAHARKTAERLEALLALGPTDREASLAAQSMGNVALAHKNARLYPDALGYARRAIAIVPASRRSNEFRAQWWSIIADSLRLSGDLEGALQAIREARRLLDAYEGEVDLGRLAVTFNVLWREGVILGDEGRIGLGKVDEATAVLQRAFEHVETWASKDADNSQPRILFISAARELGAILRSRDPERALAVYDHALRRVGEVKNARARRGEVDLLIGSSYPLRALGRTTDARRRVDEAFARLQQLEMYPADKVPLGSETESALRGRADHQAATGEIGRAIETYQELLQGTTAAGARPDDSLSDAIDVSRLYEALATLQRRAGNEIIAADLEARRMTLWQQWNAKLPNNRFVTAQLTAQ